MAKATAYAPIDISQIDLNFYSRYFYDWGLLDNVNQASPTGQVYRDVFWVEATNGMTLVFGGPNIQFNGNAITGGTVTGVGETDSFGYYLWLAEGISLSAVDMYNAALTASNADDISLIKTALSGNDIFNLSSGSDFMLGFAGNDVMRGNGGEDTLNGGAGNDTLNGASGDDRLFGTSGQDKLLGGLGNDLLNGGVHNDTLNGGGDNDTLYAGGGNDKLYGGTQADKMFGDAGNDTLNGGYGDDTLNGGGGNDTMYGGAGTDTMYGGAGDDKLGGIDGNDKLFGYGGSDTLVGGNGSDTLTGGNGKDYLWGGSAADKFDFNSMTDSPAGNGRDVIFDFSHAQGDVVDLAGVDANSGLSGNQAFTFIGGSAFSGTAGELRFMVGGANGYLQGDVDGDGHADLAIQLNGVTSMIVGDLII